MRVQQAPAEIAPTLPQAPALRHGDGHAEASQTWEKPATDSLTGARIALVPAPAAVTATVAQKVMEHPAFLTPRSVLKTSVLGVLVGAFACRMLLQVVYLASENVIRVMDSLFFASLTFLVLSLLLSFALGWRQRNGIRGALSGLVLGVTLVVGFRVGLAALPSLLPAQALDSLSLTPFFVLPFVVVLAALGGACGRGVQAKRARSGKANR